MEKPLRLKNAAERGKRRANFSSNSPFAKGAGFDPAHHKMPQSERPLLEIPSSIPFGTGTAEGKCQPSPWGERLERRASALICLKVPWPPCHLLGFPSTKKGLMPEKFF